MVCTDDPDEAYPRTVFYDVDWHVQIGHLVPANAANAGMYADVARCVFGLQDEDADGSVLQKLIHGCTVTKPKGLDSSKETGEGISENKAERKATGDGTEGNEITDDDRIPGTGLKHFVSNRIRLPRQAEYFMYVNYSCHDLGCREKLERRTVFRHLPSGKIPVRSAFCTGYSS
jgi:hypothetical protein